MGKIKNNIICLGLLFILSKTGIGQTNLTERKLSPLPTTVENIASPQQTLNGTWGFQVERGQLNTINVPGEWEMQGYHVAAGEKAIYKKEIDIPQAWMGNRILVKFDAVSSHALVKLNDQYIGEHEGGFVAFEMDLTDRAKAGKNMLTVEVRANTISDILSCTSQYAAHTVGGLLRKVTLFTLPVINIADMNAETRFDAKYVNAVLNLDATVLNQSTASGQISMRYTLNDFSGKRVFQKSSAKKQVEANSKALIAFSIPVSKPNHWSAETPYLYELTTELLSGAKVLQTNKQKIGFREISIKGNELLVNGQPVKLKGVNRHAVHPLIGRASDPDLDRKDAELFLAANLNYIRTSHYPASEEFLEAADELGLYVESESALNWIQHHASPIWRHWNYEDKRFLPIMVEANVDNVLSNKKHPSVIIWSLGNESRWSELWVEVNKVVKSLDKTRPTSFHDQTWGGFNNAGSTADIANYHYPAINGPAATDTMSRPTLFGEYAHLPTYNRRELLTDPGVRDAFNAGIIAFFDSIYMHKGNLGGAIWSGIDDTFHLPDGRIVGYGPWGPVDGWRREKPEYFGMKKAYSPIRITNPVKTDKGIELDLENRYDFRSLDKVTLKAIVDGKTIPISSSLGARAKGKLVIPGISAYKALELIAEDERGFEIEHEFFRYEDIPKIATKSATLRLKQDDTFIYITQADVVYTISKTYGLMTSVRKADGEPIMTKGPSVAIIQANAEDGGKPNVAGETYQNNIYPIKYYEQYTLFATHVEAFDQQDSIVVNVDLTYQHGTGKQQFVFTKDGLLKVNYHMNYDHQEVAVYQYGLMMELPLTFDELEWHRNGIFTYYPEDHIGRNNGKAKLNANELLEVEAHGKQQAKAWKDDANALGSNDFRSSKFHIYSAKLMNTRKNSVQVLSNGQQASRSWKQDKHIQWLIADYTNNGSEPFYTNPHSNGRIKLKKGDSIKGQVILKID